MTCSRSTRNANSTSVASATSRSPSCAATLRSSIMRNSTESLPLRRTSSPSRRAPLSRATLALLSACAIWPAVARRNDLFLGRKSLTSRSCSAHAISSAIRSNASSLAPIFTIPPTRCVSAVSRGRESSVSIRSNSACAALRREADVIALLQSREQRHDTTRIDHQDRAPTRGQARYSVPRRACRMT